jgi:hypothetical protein
MNNTILDLKNGKIVINDLHDIDFEASLESQISKLDEDLLRIKYNNGYLVDAGWYSGSFIVYVIKNCDWDKPIAKKNYNF